jgi:hypothetical protein
MKDITAFFDYIWSFYGIGGIYEFDGITQFCVYKAIAQYLLNLTETNDFTWGFGDSLDRERVRLILEGYGYEETSKAHPANVTALKLAIEIKRRNG